MRVSIQRGGDPTLKLAGKNIMLLWDRKASNGMRRASIRFRSLPRPKQINITVTRFTRSKGELWKT